MLRSTQQSGEVRKDSMRIRRANATKTRAVKTDRTRTPYKRIKFLIGENE